MFDGSQYQDVSKNRQSASGLVKWLFALAFSGLVLLSMACGDSDEAATAAPETTVPTHRPTQASEIGQGRRVEPTGSEYQGRIESGDRYQRFYFRAERGQTYIVRTSLGSLDDTEISVYGPDGSRIAYNDDFPDGRASRLNFRALEQGTYEIRVAGYDGQTGSYGLFLSMGSSPSNRGSSRSGSSDSGPTPSTYGVGVKSFSWTPTCLPKRSVETTSSPYSGGKRYNASRRNETAAVTRNGRTENAWKGTGSGVQEKRRMRGGRSKKPSVPWKKLANLWSRQLRTFHKVSPTRSMIFLAEMTDLIPDN